jgi:hypothetical protein
VLIFIEQLGMNSQGSQHKRCRRDEQVEGETDKQGMSFPVPNITFCQGSSRSWNMAGRQMKAGGLESIASLTVPHCEAYELA